MKHKHYDMIVAKAANMDLVVFQVDPNGKNKVWSEYYCEEDGDFPLFYQNCNYFLCLPQHKEACLHWLNGGAIESNETKSWVEVDSLELCTSHWYEGHFFMHEHEEFRIKPKKEKRWIAFNHENGNVFGTYSSEFNCKRAWPNLQTLEIEVEVSPQAN
ncbi:hypothetical protein NVP1181O_46 [Vibrio phage 1.181.O._10N.286.46.C9]|nr:hypothetical protein NVP1181O_46 [Vibrio phage 1.181.O._10N.286.46.C9]